MKWLVTLSVLAATTSFAADSPEIIKMKNGVTFSHKAHQTYHKSECRVCHRKAGVTPGHIEGFGKDVAHRMCRTCHAMKNAGPAKCNGCHIH